MQAFEKIAGTMLALVALYLVLSQSQSFNTIMNSLAGFNVTVLSTLQGRGPSSLVGTGSGAPSSNSFLGFGGLGQRGGGIF